MSFEKKTKIKVKKENKQKNDIQQDEICDTNEINKLYSNKCGNNKKQLEIEENNRIQLAEDAKWLDQHALDAPHLKTTPVGESLKEAMRPKPSSLKEQALSLLAKTDGPIMLGNPEYRLWESEVEIIRRALKALPE